MGFYIPEDSNYKQHINLSASAWTCLSDDIDNFYNVPQKPNLTGFINEIFLNFHEEARASISLRLSEYRGIYQKILSFHRPEEQDGLRSSLLESLLEQQEKELSSHPKAEKGDYRNIRLNEKVKSCLRDSPEPPYYQNRPGKYIQSVLEEYAGLPVVQRERIVFKETLQQIHDAIDANRLLKVSSGGRILQVLPYAVLTDKNDTFNYLTGYTEKASDDFNPALSRPASLRLSRMTDLKILRSHRYVLTAAQKQRLKKDIESKGIPFLIGDNTTISVRLTDNGLKQYRQQLHQRPAYISCDDQMHLMEFNCTEQQIMNYFFKFGKDAEVISPPSTRQKMAKKYQDGASAYTLIG